MSTQKQSSLRTWLRKERARDYDEVCQGWRDQQMRDRGYRQSFGPTWTFQANYGPQGDETFSNRPSDIALRTTGILRLLQELADEMKRTHWETELTWDPTCIQGSRP